MSRAPVSPQPLLLRPTWCNRHPVDLGREQRHIGVVPNLLPAHLQVLWEQQAAQHLWCVSQGCPPSVGRGNTPPLRAASPSHAGLPACQPTNLHHYLRRLAGHVANLEGVLHRQGRALRSLR